MRLQKLDQQKAILDLKLEGGVNVFSRIIHVPFLHTLYMRFMMDNLDEELKFFEGMMICAGFVYMFLFIHICRRLS